MTCNILSINFGGHDTSAAAMVDGKLIACGAQERFSLDKHTRSFPNEAIRYCLDTAGLTMDRIDQIAFCDDPIYYIRQMYLAPAMTDDKRIGTLLSDIERIREAYGMEARIRAETGYTGDIRFYRHHLCHIASAYYPSGFQDALVVSYDGIGERESNLICTGRDGKIEIVDQGNAYPHSLGLLYSAVTHYLGWLHHCDEGIVMGLAPYGDAGALIPGQDRTYRSVFEEILIETGDYAFEVNQDWMAYQYVRDTWISDKFTAMFGPKRDPKGEITSHHQNIAAALQERLEWLVLRQLRRLRETTGLSRLALAGGVALNCSMNGKIESSGIFDEIFVQPASGDDGNVIGACYLATLSLKGELKPKQVHDFYLGYRASEDEIVQALTESGLAYAKPADLAERTARHMVDGKIIAWYQGGAEFGPRALGNRSILARPFPAEMKDHINARVKFREYFRPFAPSALEEEVGDYFSIGQKSPHMLIACHVLPEKKDVIPAVVHVDESCRVQSVAKGVNPRFYELISAFKRLTGVPVVLNTSFNVKGQPIVNTPKQAIDTFRSTNIDVLVVGDYILEKE